MLLVMQAWTSSALNTIVMLEKERLRPADKAAVHMKPFTCFMNIRSTMSSAKSWATACCWCCQSVRALASGKWRLQRPAYAGPPYVAKHVHQVKVGYHLYTVYTSHVNVSVLFAPHVWLKTRSESNWCAHKKSIILTGQPFWSCPCLFRILHTYLIVVALTSLYHITLSTAEHYPAGRSHEMNSVALLPLCGFLVVCFLVFSSRTSYTYTTLYIRKVVGSWLLKILSGTRSY